MRPTDAAMALFPSAVAAMALWRWWPRVAVLAILVAGVGLGALPTLLVYKYLYGTYLAIPQGGITSISSSLTPGCCCSRPTAGCSITPRVSGSR